MSAHGSRIKYSEKCQHHNPAAFINNGGLSAMPRHLLAGSRRHRVGAWGSQCTDSVLPLALHGCGLWPRKTRAAAWRFIVAGMAAGTPRALPRDLLWREDGSTPCGTRTRNLRIRSPTPCPLGQGGYASLRLHNSWKACLPRSLWWSGTRRLQCHGVCWAGREIDSQLCPASPSKKQALAPPAGLEPAIFGLEV